MAGALCPCVEPVVAIESWARSVSMCIARGWALADLTTTIRDPAGKPVDL